MMLKPEEMMHYAEVLGYVGLGLVIFVETGLFFGFVLPGDSLFFVSGLLAAKGYFNITILMLVFVLTAIAGYFFGYWFGDRLGGWLENREESIFFRPKYLVMAKEFYQKHGKKTILLARIVPIVRTFAPIVSGMVKMPYGQFVIFNIIGAFIWVGLFTLSGYYLGAKYPVIMDYFLPIAAAIIILSILPGVVAFCKKRFAKS